MTPIPSSLPTLRADVVVVGGGTAGAVAATAAAQEGAEVLLLERLGFLGGTTTATSLGSLCGYFTVVDGNAEPVVGGLPITIVEQLRRRGGAPQEPLMWLRTASIPYDLFTMKLVLDEQVTRSDCRLLFHSHVIAAEVEDDCVAAITAVTPGGHIRVEASSFIDATGDAHLTSLAGGPFDSAEEPLQSPTTMFRFGGVDTATMQSVSRPALHEHLERAVAAGLPLPRTAGGMYTVRPGVVHVNITRLDGVDPFDAMSMTEAELNGREQVRLYQEAFKRFVPGFADAFVLDTGVQVGIRESRRIRGEATLTLADVTGSARFDDAIACSAWPVEDHGGGRAIRWVWLDPGQYYQIPFRAMLPRSLSNVIVAGRSISATHDAQASVRVTAQCFAMGEAAGVAAVASLQHNGNTRNVPIEKVQAALTGRGAFLGDR